MYIQVNIGRNINDEPMSDYSWDRFRLAVAQAIALAVDTNEHVPENSRGSEMHKGIGYWAGDEESCHISRYDERGFNIPQLRNDLYCLKNEFHQDAIALIIGSELI